MALIPEIAVRTVRRESPARAPLAVDICVVGSGAAGTSAALEAAALGKRVAIVDAAPSPGGQAVSSLIGTFCGLYGNGPDPIRVTYGVAGAMLAALKAKGVAHARPARNTRIVLYDEQALARWVEDSLLDADVLPLFGAVLRGAEVANGRVAALDLASRWGDLRIEAEGFVDATGDGALCWLAGAELQQPETPIWGSVMFTLEGVDGAKAGAIPRPVIHDALRARGRDHGLCREDGFVFPVPGRDIALVNMTHIETPLDPVGGSRAVLSGRAQVDRLVGFLKAEFPDAFAGASVRSYGLPGIRQTRWIRGRHRITVDEVLSGTRPADAIARCSWPIELHYAADAVHWQEFGDDHMHYVPFGAMTPAALGNVVAAGRCIDGDPAALSSVRVMGPCIAMGAAAAHALDLAGAGSVHQLDIAALQDRVRDNLQGVERDTW
ncbi:FAD-dependent oxidoreductase [Oceanibacterium hippocampi]|uniref:FAD dependent oxidoreductase n=1 Tax=Oceanibacterium hippocampi TaxID=745714 RepID=A0A1Y5T4T2_9PROT|nr:FAD-dependent oxidoreductase [Oceanibacterium hippocampi]SLN55262.1 hypothetical protein OCH7691_02374 [Oceanibacterium hippocampi]